MILILQLVCYFISFRFILFLLFLAMSQINSTREIHDKNFNTSWFNFARRGKVYDYKIEGKIHFLCPQAVVQFTCVLRSIKLLRFYNQNIELVPISRPIIFVRQFLGISFDKTRFHCFVLLTKARISIVGDIVDETIQVY